MHVIAFFAFQYIWTFLKLFEMQFLKALKKVIYDNNDNNIYNICIWSI